MNREALKDLFDYTEFTWASYERVVRAMPEGALMKAVDGSGWPSLFDALKHLVSGHDGWLNETYRVGPVLVENSNDITSWEQLIDIRTKLREESRRVLNDTPDDKLWERTTKVWEAGGQSLHMSIGEGLLHVLLHERGHHGDVSTLLHQLGARAPANDYAIYLWFKERRG